MTVTTQKRLAIGGALLLLGIFVAANVQLFLAAFGSQPACVAVEGAGIPAKRAC
ncbi:hypothetical protein [Pseudorhodobacter sp.]|jgi:hypothetical protein|uniref:hypothetical protein n=1 Tax=Pseudorhodobacter sp. TaxID=1934400 RepID=UPI002AFFCAA5|nr:hypothetical protein [Pseudorhodobacter sp.]